MVGEAPRHIALRHDVGMVIDGRLFPYPVGLEFTVHSGPDEWTGVTVFLPCDLVTVDGGLRAGRLPKAPKVRPYRPGPFVGLDIAAERRRLDDLGRRIAATRRRAARNGVIR